MDDGPRPKAAEILKNSSNLGLFCDAPSFKIYIALIHNKKVTSLWLIREYFWK